MDTSSFSTDISCPEKSAQPRHLSVAETETKHGVKFPFSIAAPSFVIPAGAADNSRFLADYFPEIGLLFFESESCLAYSDFDLPPTLATLPVSWHVHLPLDLEWHNGLDEAWRIITHLMDKAAYLSPRSWVLHPPTAPDMLVPLAARFREAGVDPATILLENVDETDLVALWPEARQGGFSTCLDLGHILAYDQQPVLDLPGLWDTVRMLHVYAAKPGSGKHLGLTHLDDEGRALLRHVLEHFRGDTLTLEVFSEEIFPSLDLLAGWMNEWSKTK
ncbi:cobamide remodeling phosphodiesterase CbiR [Pseudodesulfovibrio sp. zrk46]|uniref:cobamide remodeling phosphodiesterase CbiR n=1 Tax=Pseudodesulfovibrio sp. zrk46 TaxID=2725288 RepID=UPI001449DECA|nr:cobamide remodeling phosphodiesterase CbiR [Pseudodesulfovibrio sp. zrk46]QJB55152.1 hypothetical protein HFN16_01475 [Pseudodesulfovibrio sp. zrk46]